MNAPKKRILIVEDDPAIQELVAEFLSSIPGVELQLASHGKAGLELLRTHHFDAILTDIDMPGMDGISFLSKVRGDGLATPAMILTAYANKDNVLEALRLGAVDFIEKPFRRQALLEMVQSVLAVSGGGTPTARGPSTTGAVITPDAPALDPAALVAIGASTGGTEALRKILRELPPTIPGIVIVQHIPAGFSKAFSNSLDEICPFEVKEAETGDRVQPGRVLIAPGGQHLAIERDGQGHLVAKVFDGELVSMNRPSVDVLFDSVTQCQVQKTLGVILTGMGSDGAKGLLRMRRAGAQTIAQDEATSVVYGMPKEAAMMGAVGEVLPVQAIAKRLVELLKVKDVTGTGSGSGTSGQAAA